MEEKNHFEKSTLDLAHPRAAYPTETTDFFNLFFKIKFFESYVLNPSVSSILVLWGCHSVTFSSQKSKTLKLQVLFVKLSQGAFREKT